MLTVTGFHRQRGALACDGVPLAGHRRRRGHAALRLQRRDHRRRATARSTRRSPSHPHSIHYALKANSTLAIARLLRGLGSGADANSGGEIDVALRAGFIPAQIVFTGVGKTDAELAQAIDLGVRTINAESDGELERIDALSRAAADPRPRSRCGSTRTSTRRAIRTSRPGSRPTSSASPIDDVRELCPQTRGRAGVEIVGLHSHVGSQITDLDAAARAPPRRSSTLARELRDDGIAIEHLDLGGGLGISYDGIAGAEAQRLRRRAAAGRSAIPGLQSSSSPAATSSRRPACCSRASSTSRSSPAASCSSILDAGMTELIRPMLYSAFHRIEPVDAARRARRSSATSSGRCARAATRSARTARLPRPAVGDLFAVLDAGAYGAVMASNYNRRHDAGRSAGRGRPAPRDPPPPDDRRPAGARDLSRDEPAGILIAFEGLDQSGKQTQAEGCATTSAASGATAGCCRFPTTRRTIGAEIATALHGERDYAPGRHAAALRRQPLREEAADRDDARARARSIVCDRYVASSIAYGEAQGLDPAWLREIQRFLPPPDLTILLDIAPETAVRRKTTDRDQYERDLALLSRVRESYRRQAAAPAAGCASTASGRRTPSRPTSSAAVATTDSRGGKRAHLARPGVQQRARAGVQRRAGRAHIVHQHDVKPSTSARRRAARTRRGRWRGAAPPAGRSATASRASARSASTHRQPEVPRQLAAWLNPRARCRARCSGTGTTRSAPSSTSAPAGRISAAERPRDRSAARRTSARGRWRAACRRRRRWPAQRDWRAGGGSAGSAVARLSTRQDGSGSPQCAQSGGGTATMAAQQRGADGAAGGLVERAGAGGARRREQDGDERRPRATGRHAAASGRLGVGRRLVGDLDPLGVAPEPLERVELARLRREDVDDEREVVHQHPLGAVVAFDVRSGAPSPRAALPRPRRRSPCTCRVFWPEHSRKKSVNAGVWRRSSTTTSSAFLSSAACTAFAISPVKRLLRGASDAFVQFWPCK